MNQIARINWKRGQYSDLFRSTIVDPSPLKEGQKVRVVWGKGKKEYSATISCYPLIEEEPCDNGQPQPHQAKAKRKIVSICYFSNLTRLWFKYLECRLSNQLNSIYVNIWWQLLAYRCCPVQSPESPVQSSPVLWVPSPQSPEPAKKARKPVKGKETSGKSKEKPKGNVCINLNTLTSKISFCQVLPYCDFFER